MLNNFLDCFLVFTIGGVNKFIIKGPFGLPSKRKLNTLVTAHSQLSTKPAELRFSVGVPSSWHEAREGTLAFLPLLATKITESYYSARTTRIVLFKLVNSALRAILVSFILYLVSLFSCLVSLSY